jgi:uncharacterized protein
MPLELVFKLLRELVGEGLLASELVIVWHSGEPLTLPPQYYAEAIDAILGLCKKEAFNVSVSFDIQTNATLIGDSWCDFFEKYAQVINLGVSCDGPQELHDAFRIDWKGRDTFERTLRGMNALESRGIKYNIIAVVTKKTLSNPDVFFDFFFQRRDKLTDFHFNVLASPMAASGDLGYSAKDRTDFYQFYRTLFDLWAKKKSIGEDFPIRNFSHTLERLVTYGLPDGPSYLYEASAPLRSLNMDVIGNLTTFYAGLDVSTEANRYGDGQGLSLGNIQQQTLAEMLRSSKLAAMSEDFELSHQRCASSCDYYSVCPGGFELTQLISLHDEDCVIPETIECLIHVKALTDAILDSVDSGSDSYSELAQQTN